MSDSALQTPWQRSVARAIKSIPRGKTASYAVVAMLAGKPGAARAVVRALQRTKAVPWWRVVKSDGTVAVEMATRQIPLLRKEGVVVVNRRVHQAARWRP